MVMLYVYVHFAHIQVTELILDNCRSTSIVGLTDDFTALETLSLINVGLTTLKGFPTLPNLKKLELSDNRISSGLSHLAASTKLTHLNLSGNKIKDLEELKALDKFQSLLVLDLFNNEATSIDSYREKIFALIPSLKYLDEYVCQTGMLVFMLTNLLLVHCMHTHTVSMRTTWRRCPTARRTMT